MSRRARPDRLTSINSAQGIDLKTLAKLTAASVAALAFAAPALAEWQEASSKHFLVYSNDTPERVRQYTIRLERFDQAVRAMRGLKDPPISPSGRVSVYLLKDAAELHSIMPKGMDNVAGQYIPRAAGPTAFMSREYGDGSFQQAVMLHEYTHHIMYSAWGGSVFPTWFSEGFAEYHATARFNGDGSVTFGAPPAYRSYGISKMNMMPIEQVLKDRPKLSDGRAQAAFYARSWLLFHYLQSDPDRQQQFRSYIGAINSGKPAEEANKIFGSPSALDIKMTGWAQRPSYPPATIPANRIEVGDVTVRALGPGEAAAMPALIRSRYGVDPKTTALGVVDTARKVAAQYPNDAAAQNELAEAEFDARNFAASEAAADRALAANPNSVHALLYKGMAGEEQLKAAKSTDAAAWSKVRAAYRAANKLEPEYAEPLIRFYMSYVSAGQKPSPNAQSGLLYAQMLAPADPEARLEATKVLLDQNKPTDAQRMLEPLVYMLENRKQGEFATRALDALKAGDSAKARSILEEAEKADAPAKDDKKA